MRLFLLTSLTMLAFAANSVLNRAALSAGAIAALPFGTLRLLAGAVALGALCLALRGGLRLAGPGRMAAVAGLLAYIYGFSAAYQALDAGLGALILFGMVQVSMFAGSLAGGERPPPQRWAGACLALIGLGWLFWPGDAARISLAHGALMAMAGIGWGVYSLAGRLASDPLAATAANFLLAATGGLLLSAAWPAPPVPVPSSETGITLALVSGAVTSGLGYALWYRVLPDLPGTVAAVAQLTVPVLAMLGGVIVLGEPLTAAFAVAAGLVLGGVALSLVPARRL